MEHCGTSVDVDEYPKNNNYFSGTFVQGKESTVIFNVKAKTSFGEQVFIVGNCAALGDWDIHHAAKMKTDDSSYPIWCASLQLDQGRGIEYKYIIRGDWDPDHVIWETGTNRKLGVHGLWMVIDDSHFGSGTKELVKCLSENGSTSSSTDTLPSSSSSSNRSPLTHSSSFGSPISLTNLISFNGMNSANPPSSSPSPFSAFPNGNNNERLSSSQERPQPMNDSSSSNSLPRISRYHMFNNSLWNNLNEQLEVFSQLEAKHLNEKTKLENELADIKLKLQASEMALQKSAKELAFLQGKDMKYFSVTELKKLAQISNSVFSQANDLIVKKLEDFVEFAQSQQECVACMDRPIDTIIQPCGHYVVCTECGTKVGKCPVCNVKITKLQKVFPK